MVPMSDGTRLAIDIYRPDAPGKFPALVERTPYDKTKSSEIQVGAHTFFAERGYVFLVQDTRGRFASEGAFYPFLDDALAAQPGRLRHGAVDRAAALVGRQGRRAGRLLHRPDRVHDRAHAAARVARAVRARVGRGPVRPLGLPGRRFRAGIHRDLVHAHLRSRYRRTRLPRRRRRQAPPRRGRSPARSRTSGICRSRPIRRCAGHPDGSTSTTGSTTTGTGPFWWQQNVRAQP